MIFDVGALLGQLKSNLAEMFTECSQTKFIFSPNRKSTTETRGHKIPYNRCSLNVQCLFAASFDNIFSLYMYHIKLSLYSLQIDFAQPFILISSGSIWDQHPNFIFLFQTKFCCFFSLESLTMNHSLQHLLVSATYATCTL